jgi:hypothetical protein
MSERFCGTFIRFVAQHDEVRLSINKKSICIFMMLTLFVMALSDMCACVSVNVSFNSRNAPTNRENPLSRIISFNFFICGRRDAVSYWTE